MEDQGIPTASPVPLKDEVIKTLSFFDALKELAGGKRITKLEWADKNSYGILTDGRLRIMLKDGLHDWIVSDGDLNGVDWIILD